MGAIGAWAEPTDGFYWPEGWYHHLDTFQSQLRFWEGNIVPADGGVAYWRGPQAGDIKFGSPVTLRGLDFGNVKVANGGNADCGDITISCGFVTATGGRNAAGIGAGYNATCGTVSIADPSKVTQN